MVKMQSVPEITIFGLKMMVKSGLFRRNTFEIPPCACHFLLNEPQGRKNFDQKYKFSNENNYLPAWRDFKNNFLDHFSPSFLGEKWYFWTQIPF